MPFDGGRVRLRDAAVPPLAHRALAAMAAHAGRGTIILAGELLGLVVDAFAQAEDESEHHLSRL